MIVPWVWLIIAADGHSRRGDKQKKTESVKSVTTAHSCNENFAPRGLFCMSFFFYLCRGPFWCKSGRVANRWRQPPPADRHTRTKRWLHHRNPLTGLDLKSVSNPFFVQKQQQHKAPDAAREKNVFYSVSFRHWSRTQFPRATRRELGR